MVKKILCKILLALQLCCLSCYLIVAILMDNVKKYTFDNTQGIVSIILLYLVIIPLYPCFILYKLADKINSQQESTSISALVMPYINTVPNQPKSQERMSSNDTFKQVL